MPLISQSIKSLKGGVSQQPDTLRFPDQGDYQENGFSSEVEGLQKRPPTVHRARLGAPFTDNPLIHPINRDAAERYLVAVQQGALKVWDLHGNPKVVTAPEGYGYLSSANPRDDIRCVTIADYTFIVNRKVIVTDDPLDKWPSRPNEAFIWVKQGQYGKTYTVTVSFSDGASQVITYTTPDGSQAAHALSVDSGAIRNQLVAAANSPRLTAIATENGGVYLTPKAGFTISKIAIQDGFNGNSMVGFMGSVQRFNQLPPQCYPDYVVKVAGDPGQGEDDYYLQYIEGERLWRECAQPGSIRSLKKTTMPHVLVREANGTFTFRSNDWGHRRAGDDDSNPFPSFVGQPINDIYFFRNRLGTIAGENFVLSVAGEFFKFFPPSVVVMEDTDPIDSAISYSSVANLHNAVPFKEDLVLFAEQAQFVLKADGVLSSKTAKADLTTEFESFPAVRPCGAGRSIFFPTPRATFTSIKRFYAVQDVSDVKDAADVTAHVPSFIPNGVFRMGASTSENFLTILSTGDEEKLWVYKFLFLEDQLVQQSWSHWRFKGCRVLSAEFFGPELYLVLSNAAGTFLERMAFTKNTLDFHEEPYRLYMDRKVRLEVPVNAGFDPYLVTTQVDLGALYGATPVPGDVYYAVNSEGRVWEFPEYPSGVITIPEDVRGKTLIIGKRFRFEYKFSKFLIKKQTEQGQTSEDEGRLQIRYAWVNFQDSGPFTVEVQLDSRKPFVYSQTSRILGSSSNRLGVLPLETGQKRFPVQSETNRATVSIISEGVSPIALVGAGWEGFYNRRNRGI
ncbi:hypothetical protein DBR00_02455 [Pseudomonas sp. HMWF032]|uniref:phage nozzle protein n=1 Tax=Pseudomonas sp. HMWF032 TaxID=2056866 RepID=UPI000D3B0580|nr:hypothetical protein [Pseudomonas sp. HMWF032]PTS86436.1 hypothetical protein DBR00_02455 [Pseudomonas sp. HMWF032]PTT81375.1 hypothetical protein DBR41_17075 [Pseudomonas sp. HMWF010]